MPLPCRQRLADLIAAASITAPPALSNQQLTEAISAIGESRELVDALAHWQLIATSVPDSQFPTIAVEVFTGLGHVETDGGNPAFPEPALHLVRASDTLRGRAKLTAFLLRYQYDEHFASGHDQHLKDTAAAGEMVFESSQGLWEGLYLFDAYLGPLLGAISPAVWCFAAPRAFGVAVFSFGGPVNGRRPTIAAEPLHMLAVKDNARTTVFPHLAPGACSQALTWWCHHL